MLVIASEVARDSSCPGTHYQMGMIDMGRGNEFDDI